MSTEEMIFEKIIHSSPSNVFFAFTNATGLKEWLCDIASVIPEPGGRFYAGWNSGYYAAGEFIELEKDQKVGFSWFGKDEPAQTMVTIRLFADNSGTRITLTHKDIGQGETWDSFRENCREGWENGLENLASVLETGQDLRLTMRPMLGIGLNDFNQKIADQLGVPTSKGIRIDSTLEGMGAEKTGLKADDVIISIDGISISTFTDINKALQGKRVGDVVEIGYYRGPSKNRGFLGLSQRPLPDIVFDPQVLSSQISDNYDELTEELDSITSGITEEVASFKPTPEEWSVKEIIAHLIHAERYWLGRIPEMVNGYERWADDFGTNLQFQVEATLSEFQTVEELKKELRRTRTEIASLIKYLPEEFLERRNAFWRLGLNFLDGPYHDRSHFDQMRSVIKTARKGSN
jgi:uncharacterized protein YndB with AHSA1/START domain